MTKVNFIKDIKEFDYLTGIDQKYIVIGVSSSFTIEVFNIDTWEEETIEGDYYDNGNLSHRGLLNYGNIEAYILTIDSRAVAYKQKLTNKVNELKEFYYA